MNRGRSATIIGRVIEISFHGAAQTVTGSNYRVAAGGASVLVDCGMFQGDWDIRQKNWAEPRYDPAKEPVVILTHAHIDHSGLLPRLVRKGFRGKILASPPTRALLDILLADSAKLQEEEAEYRNRKGITRHKPALPLYTSDDADAALKLAEARKAGEWHEIPGPFRFRYHPVGHLLGAEMVELEVTGSGSSKSTILFSGDVGRYGVPMAKDPEAPPACDHLVIESTYGDRSHGRRDPFDQMASIVTETFDRNGIVLVPAFAVGRAQLVVFILEELKRRGRLGSFPIYLDSPMAVDATEIYCTYTKQLDVDVTLPGGKCLLYGRDVHLCRTRDESIALNDIGKGAVIIASSGMLSGGRIMHHLRRVLPQTECTLAMSGFQPAGGLGRRLLDGAETVRIHKREIPVRARVVSIEGLSGHADATELVRFAKGLPAAPKRTFVTHGEPDPARVLAKRLRRELGHDAHAPQIHETVRLEA